MPRRRRISRKGSPGSRPSWPVEPSRCGRIGLWCSQRPEKGGEQMIRRLAFLAMIACAALPGGARADDLSALARLDAAASSVREAGGATQVTLALSQPVPWRLFTVDGPPRLVMDFRTLTLAGAVDGAAGLVAGVATGRSEDGWSRMVLTLNGPAAVDEAGLATAPDGSARLRVRLAPTDAESFAAEATPLPQPPEAEPAPREGRPVVVLDPGHGGIDPGAEAGGLNEKTLIRGGLFDVALTRERDEFVPLDTRISRARAAGASVFLSLHADELPEGAGDASGITVYTLAETATDEASLRLAERHDKNDLLAGVSVAEPGDEIALVLMDLARTDTGPRSAALAETLKSAFRSEALPLVGRPLRSAAFSVLKAADFPSALIELGFLSSEADRARLTDPEWRAAAIRAIETALVQWSLDDSARSGLLRQ